MEGAYSFKIPGKSILYLVIYIGILISLICFVLAPNKGALSKLDGDIKVIENKIKEQETFSPLYESYRKEMDISRPGPLPLPQKEGLLWDRADDISNVFQGIASNSGMYITAVVPEVSSLDNNSGILKLRINLKGDFPDLQKFLTELGAMPSLEGIEEIMIQSADKDKECRLKVRIALKQ